MWLKFPLQRNRGGVFRVSIKCNGENLIAQSGTFKFHFGKADELGYAVKPKVSFPQTTLCGTINQRVWILRSRVAR